MRGVDTNVLIRIVLLDDKRQARIIERLIKQLTSRREALFITSVALCEFVWVLHRRYELPREEIADAIRQLLDSDLVAAEYPDAFRESAELYRRGPGDFADYLIGMISQSAGCRDVVTFDRALRSASGFTQLE